MLVEKRFDGADLCWTAAVVQKVVPFNITAWLKSPMGMMAAFMLFAIVIMPYLKVSHFLVARKLFEPLKTLPCCRHDHPVFEGPPRDA